MDARFYVGPLGSMQPLPDVNTSVGVELERIGSSSSSLMGNAWRDTLGYRRSWTWTWTDLLPAQTPYVDALAGGMVRGPLRLVDPRRANRLPEQIASGGSRTRSTRGFTVTAGGLVYRDLGRVEPDPSTLGPRAMLRGCIEWQRKSSADAILYPTGQEWGGTWLVPLLPGEETLQLSCWVAGKAGLRVELRWNEYPADGWGAAYFSEATTDTAELTAGRWQLLTCNVAPQDGSVGLLPRLWVDGTQPSGSILTTGWQVAALDAEQRPEGLWSGQVPGELSAGWRPGGGAPYVVADPAGGGYPRSGFHDTGLVLVET